MTLLLVAAGAAVGAPARFLTDLVLAHYAGRRLPWGTLAVNTIGSGLAVFLTVTVTDPRWSALLITGFCGALTTYSTLSYETLLLVEDGRWHHAAANVAANLTGGAAAGLLGFAAAHLIAS
ncbi:CrcB family protein [Glycomyces sp. TRM65418]|uniref:fluoride efflux transporter FluC n=1 Tax=Glycomyces sp. TRM65418 TaxID=2867006 RepID=UPI001CE6A3A3|nr:CrcB family protein [Glycomyces sp. TRM65418]MCC3764164.1 CrcB family protein [Glycomyces sp. TRM65418]QZD53849.1 CrcB family protein [Glycomyces sp. TRM65418]